MTQFPRVPKETFRGLRKVASIVSPACQTGSEHSACDIDNRHTATFSLDERATDLNRGVVRIFPERRMDMARTRGSKRVGGLDARLPQRWVNQPVGRKYEGPVHRPAAGRETFFNKRYVLAKPIV